MKVTTTLLKEILVKTYGQVLPAIKLLKKDYGIDISRNAIYKRIRNTTSISDAIDEAVENLKDIAEHELARNIAKGNMDAIKFFLRTKGKDRGYIEKVEQQHSGSVNVNQNAPDLSNWSDKDLKAYIELVRKNELNQKSKQ